MNKKKMYVIDKARELFIEQGYHATSIQDILEYSNVSKGTFYNYFQSKSDLFKAVFTTIQENTRAERDKLLVGEDAHDPDVFAQQLTLILTLNRRNKLIQLIDDVVVSNDQELVQMIKESRFQFLQWVYNRFHNIFGEEVKPYLMDAAVMFIGMLQSIFSLNHSSKSTLTIENIVEYCLNRITAMLVNVKETDERLFSSQKIASLIRSGDSEAAVNHSFSIAADVLKKALEKSTELSDAKRENSLKLLYFIQEELLENKEEPRAFLINSALSSLENTSEVKCLREFEVFKEKLQAMGFKTE